MIPSTPSNNEDMSKFHQLADAVRNTLPLPLSLYLRSNLDQTHTLDVDALKSDIRTLKYALEQMAKTQTVLLEFIQHQLGK